MRVDRLLETFSLTIRVTHYPLHLETPDEGQSLEKLFAGRDVDIEQMQEQMASLMRSEGLEYGERRMTYNSRRAQQLATWAITREGGDAIHQALFVAYFVEDTNLADVDRLVEIAEGIGLDPDGARRALRDSRYRAAVSADWERSRTLGVTGVPTFQAAGRAVVGVQPYEVLAQLVELAGAVRR